MIRILITINEKRVNHPYKLYEGDVIEQHKEVTKLISKRVKEFLEDKTQVMSTDYNDGMKITWMR